MIGGYMLVKTKEISTTPNTTQPALPAPPYTSLLSKVERGIKREQKLYDLQTQYHYALTQYFSCINANYEYINFFLPIYNALCFPENYFFVQDSKLCYFSYTYIPYQNNYYPQLCIFKMPLSSKNPIETNFIHSLYRLISKKSHLTAHQKREFAYFIKRPNSLILYNFLLNSCILIDENLYIKKDSHLELLSKKHFDDLGVNVNNILTPELLNYVKEHLTDKYETERPENNYFIYLSTLESTECHLTYISAENSNELFSHVPLTSSALASLFPKTSEKFSEYFPRSRFNKCIMLSSQKPICTAFIANFMYILTNGDYNTLNSLAKLFAAMATPELSANVPFVILCPPETRDALLNTFSTIFQSANDTFLIYNNALPYPSLMDLHSSKCLHNLITLENANARAIVTTDCHYKQKNSTGSNTGSIIKNLLRGRLITHTDNILGTISYRNTLPIIFFPSTTEELNTISMISKPVILNLNHLTEKSFTDNNLTSNWDANSYDWLNVTFTLYGLLLLGNKKYCLSTPDTSTRGNNFDTKTILKDFISSCCNIDSASNCFTYASDLHTAYKTFVQEKYSITPEKRKDMIQHMQTIYNLTYKRPHASRTQSNKYAIMGISLKDNWEAATEKFPNTYSTDNTLWKETLSQIDSIVPDSLYSE